MLLAEINIECFRDTKKYFIYSSKRRGEWEGLSHRLSYFFYLFDVYILCGMHKLPLVKVNKILVDTDESCHFLQHLFDDYSHKEFLCKFLKLTCYSSQQLYLVSAIFY